MTTTRPTVGKLTVPFMVDEANDPINFARIDPQRIDVCATQTRCGVCGSRIRKGPIAFIGPNDGRTCFADPWMHLGCAEVATAQCPFLAGRRGWKDGLTDIVKPYADGMVIVLAYNWRSHSDRGVWHFEALGHVTVQA